MNASIERRKFLVGATSLVGATGLAISVWPFLASMKPSARARAAGAPIEVDMSKIELGQLLTVEWRGQPVWILMRSKEMLDRLDSLRQILLDPDSEVTSQQPEYARNRYRSIRPKILIVSGVCTHLGCTPKYRPEVATVDLGPDWQGGFFCPCHGSKFDLAGRVFKGVPAPRNLRIPPHQFLSSTIVRIGRVTASG